MNGPLSIHPTADGTVTVYSPEYGQTMHSDSGAYEESLLKHVRPSRVLERNAGLGTVLDIGFGIGYNVLALLVACAERGGDKMPNIISLEKDPPPLALMEKITFNDERDRWYAMVKDAAKNGEYRSAAVSITLIPGDARQSVRSIAAGSIDAVFHDPYSPAKNPELWSLDFMRELARVSSLSAIVTTYSAAPQVRGALLQAGFRIGRIPQVGKKREGTCATRDGLIDELGPEEIEVIRRSVKSTPYRDPVLTGSREELIQGRLDEMRALRLGLK